jgi:hypothetical protein
MFKMVATAGIVAMDSTVVLAVGADAAPATANSTDAVTMNAKRSATPLAKHHKRHKHPRHSKHNHGAATAAASPATATPTSPANQLAASRCKHERPSEPT